jgi:hypothetical protein
MLEANLELEYTYSRITSRRSTPELPKKPVLGSDHRTTWMYCVGQLRYRAQTVKVLIAVNKLPAFDS